MSAAASCSSRARPARRRAGSMWMARCWGRTKGRDWRGSGNETKNRTRHAHAGNQTERTLRKPSRPMPRPCRPWWPTSRPAVRHSGRRRRRSRARQAPGARQAAAARPRGSSCSIRARPSSELSPLAAYGMYDGRRARRRHHHRHRPGRRASECMIVCNDATVKGGTYYPITVKKHLRAQEIAEQNRPALHLPGRFGRRQPAATRTRCSPTATTSAASSTTRPTCSAQGIAQIAVVMGSCTAGGAYVPAMSDESIIVQEPGHHLPGRPAAGEGGHRRGGARAEDLGGGGRAHAAVGRGRPPRAERPARARRSRAQRRPTSTGASAAEDPAQRPRLRAAYPAEELYGVIPTDTRKPFDVREIIARIVDG